MIEAVPRGSVAIARISGRQPGEVVEGDVPDDFDDELRGEFGGGVVQLRREFEPHLPGVLDEAGSGVLAQVAEGLPQGLVVDRPCGDGLGLDGGPCLRVARRVAGEDVVEGARCGIALGERLTEVPGFP